MMNASKLIRSITIAGLCGLLGAQISAQPSTATTPDSSTAGNPAPVTDPPPGLPTVEGSAAPGVAWLSRDEFGLSLLVLAFGTIVLLLEFGLLRKTDASPEDTLRVYGVTLILVGALFIVTAGFDLDKVAPVTGLFGTVAGYLVGARKTESKGRGTNG